MAGHAFCWFFHDNVFSTRRLSCPALNRSCLSFAEGHAKNKVSKNFTQVIMEYNKENYQAASNFQIQATVKSTWPAYVLPFAVFMALTAASGYLPDFKHLFYIAKTIIVGAMLWCWRSEYKQDFSQQFAPVEYLISILAGLIVLAVWILPENILPQLGSPAGFNPYLFGWGPQAALVLLAVRLVGAALVVPIMEELFWRSFLLRYIINPDFQKVALGAFTWFSFAAVVVLFGVEHYRWIQGMIAGVFYTMLVIRQKSLTGCVVAHGTTNLGLGVYVITTQKWFFW